MLEVSALMVFYENMLALNNLDLRCGADQITGVFGANSAGKSTLMYTLSGIMQDKQKKQDMAGGERITVSGDITFLGQDIGRLKPSQRARLGIILCPERRRIFSESSVLENLKIGGYLATPAQARNTLEYVYSVFPDLARLRRRTGGLLSGGEQQMLAIGRALMAQPRLLLLDEPLMGLSPLMQASLLQAIHRIREERDIAIVITEQYARPVFPIIDYGYILENGSVVLAGARDELMDNPDIRSAYFGISEASA